ncbi:MAG: SDR family oxidoreductase [Chitinophagales bacterium]|jgi:NAD(P)-dependent dehydrogenase (short-subunit alcohol dehydrogenase family)|nr:SDR family oxidoreductase [Chitinophagales bacterium]
MNNVLFDLTGKIAIVTGASGLIGSHHCRALASHGAHVVVADIDIEGCKRVVDSLPNPSNHFAISFDVTNKKSIEAAKVEILLQYNKIDILVNNAAINDMFENPALAANQSMFEHYPEDMLDKSMQVNIKGVFLCSQVFGQAMKAQKKGSIINIASTYGIVGPDQSIYKDQFGNQSFYKSAAYPITKGAVINFTRFLAAYWGKDGIRVNTLSPGGVANGQDTFFVQNYTAKTPIGRMAQPNDYEGAIVFLASDASSYMTGANLIVDGGWTAI